MKTPPLIAPRRYKHDRPLRRWFHAVAAVLLCLVGVRVADAQPGDALTATATSQRVKTAPGDRFAVAIVLNFAEGWHAWPNKPVVPKGMEDLVTIPTEVKLAKDMPAPLGVNAHLDRVQWPEARTIESAAFTGDPVKIQAYTQRAVIYVPVTIGADAKPGEVVLAFDVSYQACNDTMCLPPTAAHASVKFEVVGAGDATETTKDEAAFKDFKASVFAEMSDGSKTARPGPVVPAAKKPGEVMSATAIAQHATTAPGDQFAVAVVMTLDDGWHVWPNNPVIPKGLENDLTATPTTVEVSKGFVAPKGIGIHVDHEQWPEPREVESAGFTGSPVKVLSHAGRFVVYIPITVAADAKPGEIEVPLDIHYQACNDTTCVQPTTGHTSVKFRVGKAVEAGADEAEFSGFKASVFAQILGGGPSAATTPGAQPPSSGSAAPRPSLFGYEFPDPSGPVGIAVLLVVSMIGGALMNITPCVLPVIPIKVMTLRQHAGSDHGTLRLGLFMAFGIVSFWTAIGVPMAFFSSALDPSRFIFGIWWVTLTLGLIIVLMALGLMGMFNLTLPQSVYAINPKADTAWGSYVFGIMTAVLGLPCFGFVAGGLLAAAATMPAISTMSVFFGIGAGMAIPWLVLSAKPELLSKIPRTGPAGELVKQVLGLMLIAAAMYFVTSGIQTLVKTKPYVGATMIWWVPAILLAAAALWLTLRTFQITKKAGPRIVIAAASLLLIAGPFAFSMSEMAIQKKNYLAIKAAETAGDGFVTGAWNLYTPAKFEKARAAGKIVVADFTADWCLICKSLKRGVLDVDPVESELMKSDVVALEVDVSAEDAPGWKFLNEYGRTGIPTLMIFTPGVEQPEIFNAYTSTTIMDALKRAREKAR